MEFNMNQARYAGFWIRLLAHFLDGLILGIPFIIIAGILTLVTGLESIGYLIYVILVGLIVYLQGVYGGTPGKFVMKIRIVTPEGKFIGISGAVIRNLAKIISGMAFGIGHLMIAWDQKKQSLHDKISKTYVVHKP
jgi:uncharacterized RDD family membrane protein YckC